MEITDKQALSHSEIYKIIKEEGAVGNNKIATYLEIMADNFDISEVFDIIAYVDTPDVLGK